jgi:hypothetical protein
MYEYICTHNLYEFSEPIGPLGSALLLLVFQPSADLLLASLSSAYLLLAILHSGDVLLALLHFAELHWSY